MKPHALHFGQQRKDKGRRRWDKESIPQSVVDADPDDGTVYDNTVLHDKRLVVLQCESVSLLPLSSQRPCSSYTLIHTASHDQTSSVDPKPNGQRLGIG